jgi:hypothetical protein
MKFQCPPPFTSLQVPNVDILTVFDALSLLKKVDVFKVTSSVSSPPRPAVANRLPISVPPPYSIVLYAVRVVSYLMYIMTGYRLILTGETSRQRGQTLA